MRVMREPVERGRREQRALKQIGPFRERAIRGDDEGAAFLSFVDHFIEIFGTGRRQRLEPEVVEDQHIGARVDEQASLVGAVSAPAVQMPEHARGGDKRLARAQPVSTVGQPGCRAARSAPTSDRPGSRSRPALRATASLRRRNRRTRGDRA